MKRHLEKRDAVAPVSVERAVVEFEVVRDPELGSIREEELAVVERASDGGMDANDRILEDPDAVAEAPEAEGA